MKIIRLLPMPWSSVLKCPECGSSDDIIPYDGGWCCRDCGCEWN